VTKEIRQVSAAQLPNVFFNEEIDLSKGFEAPATIRAVERLRDRNARTPALLLPRNKDKK